jgi:hypothetical protein
MDRKTHCLYRMTFNPIQTKVLAIADLTSDQAGILNHKISDPFTRWYPDQRLGGWKMVWWRILAAARSALAMMLFVAMIVVIMLAVADTPFPTGSQFHPAAPPAPEAVISGASFQQQ